MISLQPLTLTFVVVAVALAAAAPERQRRFLLDTEGAPVGGTPGTVPGFFSWDIDTGSKLQLQDTAKVLESIDEIFERGRKIGQLSMGFGTIAGNFRLYFILERQGYTTDVGKLGETGDAFTRLDDAMRKTSRQVVNFIDDLRVAVEDDVDDLADLFEVTLQTCGTAVADLDLLLPPAEQALNELDPEDRDKEDEVDTVLTWIDNIRYANQDLKDEFEKLLTAAGISYDD